MIPALDEERMQEVRAGYAKIDKPAANLGKLEDMVVDLAGMLGKDLPDKLKTAMVLMCGDHGIAKYGVSAYPQARYCRCYRAGSSCARRCFRLRCRHCL